REAERAAAHDRAVVESPTAQRERPTDRQLRALLGSVRARAADRHFSNGRRMAGLGQYEEALVEFQLAAELNPGQSEVDKAVRDTRTALRNRVAITRDGRTQLETLIEQSRDLPPPGLDVPANAKLADSLVFREASSRDVFIALGRLGDVNVAFDPTFRESPVTIELRNVMLDDALAAVTASTRTFYRVTAPKTVTIIPDTPTKRREYEEEVIRTFYLSNADIKETIDLLRIVVDNRRISPITATNAITIKDTPERIAAASKVIGAIDKARAELVIDVELLEVDRTRLKEYGLEIASPGSDAGGVSGAADVNRSGGISLRDLRSLTQADILLTGLPALYYRLLKLDTDTRTLANPQLRTTEGMAAQARFGERVPIPVTTFAPIATGGVNQQPITSFNYENIGVNIDITPRIHHNDEVSLTLKIEVSNISGEGFGGLPTFGNRSITTTIRLRDGETNMLAGLIRDEERRVARGIPGLSDLPVLGRLFAANRLETQETDIILVLTPHIVRVLDVNESDLRAFRVGREATVGSSIIELPGPVQPPISPTPPPATPDLPNAVPGSQPGAPGQTAPIRPPRPPD
ncbi:MAG: secretin N-terminal domain-containing protein, partial [Vicinamibacterales bacterium]